MRLPPERPARTLTREEYEEALRQISVYEASLLKQERALKVAQAREQLIPFAQLMKPDPLDPLNPNLSRYDAAKHHRAIAAALEEVEAGNWLRVIINCPPRHGKSELASRLLPAWFMGRDPYRSIILGTYGEDFALDFGREVREYMQSDVYREIFPHVRLAYGSKAAERLKTKEGGQAVFVGRGGSLTGRGADLLIIDDPIKDDKEARSATIRDQLWTWFTRVALTRLMTAAGRVVIIQTRWHEDDLVGRLLDPNNPHYNAEEAKKWKVIDLPALAGDNDPLGRAPGEPLWPQRISKQHLHSMRAIDPVGFSALYQGRPTPETGDFFQAEYIKTYSPQMLPSELRYYAASDHAVGTTQRNDYTCLVVVGVDKDDVIWLVDCWWRRAKSDAVVEAMLQMMKTYPIQMWWAERGHISKSIGPFLHRRMREEKVYCAISEQTPVQDKRTRAQSIQARMAMGMVMFPKFAPWFAKAKSELLSFDGGVHDDFVDAIAHIGMGLAGMVRAKPKKTPPKEYPVGTLGWLKQQAEVERRRKQLASATGGF